MVLLLLAAFLFTCFSMIFGHDYSPTAIRLLSQSPLVSTRLDPQALAVVRSLSIAKRRVKHVHRGSRAGIDTKRARFARANFHLCLVNTRSLPRKSSIINNLIRSSSPDVLAITESWLLPTDGDEILQALCPDGYCGLSIPRSPERRGGGIALVLRETVYVHQTESPDFSTFEHVHVVLQVRFTTTCLRLLTIYRPPAGNINNFLDEFSQLLESALAERKADHRRGLQHSRRACK